MKKRCLHGCRFSGEAARWKLSRPYVAKTYPYIASFLVTFAGSIAALGQLQRAARQLGASEAALERMGAFHQPTDRPEIDRIIAEVRARLDSAAFQTAWAEGRETTLEQAVANALEIVANQTHRGSEP
jgi:hypothetical protein